LKKRKSMVGKRRLDSDKTKIPSGTKSQSFANFRLAYSRSRRFS
jgi:hypothetical protein